MSFSKWGLLKGERVQLRSWLRRMERRLPWMMTRATVESGVLHRLEVTCEPRSRAGAHAQGRQKWDFHAKGP